MMAAKPLAEPVKFEFDREFSKGAVVTPRAPRKKTRWNAEEVEEIRNEAYASGEAAGRESVEADAARQVEAAIARIAEGVATLPGTLATHRAEVREEAVGLALSVARKLVPALMEQAPTAEIEAIFSRSLDFLRDEPRVVVELSEHDHALAEPHLQQMAEDQGFEGILVVRTNEDIAPGDVRIEWATGDVVRDTAALDARIEDIIRNYLKAPATEETEQSDFFALLGIDKTEQ